MATEAPAAAAPAKKSTVPKEVIARLSKGDEGAAPKPAAAGASPAGGTPAAAAAPAAAAPAGAAPAGAPVTAAAAAGEGKRVKKKAGGDLPPIPAAAAPAGSPGAPATVADVRAAIAEARPTAGAAPAAGAIRPEDQRDFELAQFAAKQHPEKYADLPQRMTAFFTARDQFVQQKATEYGGQNTPEFRDFLKGEEMRNFVQQNAPGYQRGDGTRVYEEYLEHRGAERARKELEPELDKVRRRQDEIEKAPVIADVVQKGVNEMLGGNDAAPDPDLVQFAKAPVDFIQANEVEGEIITSTGNFYRGAMEETMRYVNGLSQAPAGQAPTSTQAWIGKFIENRESEIERLYPNGVRMPDGKILVSENQMKRLTSANAANLGDYRTVAPVEIVGMIAAEGREEIKKRLREQRQRLEKSGYKKVAAPAAAPAPGPKTSPASAPASPMAGSSPARGASAGGPPATGEKWFERYTKG